MSISAAPAPRYCDSPLSPPPSARGCDDGLWPGKRAHSMSKGEDLWGPGEVPPEIW